MINIEKVLVTGPVTFRRGILLLTGKNTQILGGYVEELINQNHSMETTLASLYVILKKLYNLIVSSQHSLKKYRFDSFFLGKIENSFKNIGKQIEI